MIVNNVDQTNLVFQGGGDVLQGRPADGGGDVQ